MRYSGAGAYLKIASWDKSDGYNNQQSNKEIDT
jgi:hypothetical protein